jgi:anti-anti-sigma factor
MSQSPNSCLAWTLDGGVLVMTITESAVQGEEMAARLRERMLAAVHESGAGDAVVDFQHTRYISSAAFWPLLSVYRLLQERGGRLTVCGLSPTVGDIFYTTRLISRGGGSAALFGVAPDAASAVAALRQRKP